jgi:predicted alpha/beta-hydrolase family hydrolase
VKKQEWKVAVGADSVSAVYEPATSPEEAAVYVFAHGAGGSMSDRGMLGTANALRARGFGVVRYNFLYKEKKSSRPDAMPKLMETVSAVVARVRQELGAGLRKSRSLDFARDDNPDGVVTGPARPPLIIGGRSMGGRAASMLAAEGFDADGLLLLAYPLHPAGKPEKLRDAHLSKISMPVLALSGTRDALCTRALMEKALETVTAPWQMRWIDGADHGFHVLKSSGRTDDDVMQEIARVSSEWVGELPSRV